MSKMSTETVRHALNGETMGTRWSALFHTSGPFDTGPVQAALQEAVDEVDRQMSTWNPESDLMRLNAAPTSEWLGIPDRLAQVIRLGLETGIVSGGAFDITMGDAVTAWGFGAAGADPANIRSALETERVPAHQAIELDTKTGRIRKLRPVRIDLNGIAKGYGTDRLAETLAGFGIKDNLVGIDGEIRATGLRPDGEPWAIAVEAPEHGRRAPHSVLALQDAAVATSGDYRHWVEIQGRNLSHTMDPRRGGPLLDSPASVTVVAQTCAEADAWATALMVMGVEKGSRRARELGLDALFLVRDPENGITPVGTGSLFQQQAA
jgi:thiamine biosynthesis lipoprotein